MYRWSKILNAILYKHLGIDIDNTLNLNTHFKRESSRLRLLEKDKGRDIGTGEALGTRAPLRFCKETKICPFYFQEVPL